MMKRIATYTMVFLLASMFLVSFTGIRLLIHQCLACDSTDIALLGFAAEDASDLHNKHAGEAVCHLPLETAEDPACCESHEHDHADHCGDCCETEVHYLKNDYKVSLEKMEVRVMPIEVAVLIHNLLPAPEGDAPAVIKHRARPDNAPPRIAGRDFVIYSHQLKIS